MPTRQVNANAGRPTPTLIWWQAPDGKWDIEAQTRLVTALHQTGGGPGVLVGLAEFGQAGVAMEVHFLDFVPLNTAEPGRIGLSDLVGIQTTVDLSPGMSVVGLAVPESWGPINERVDVDALQFLPDGALFIRVGDDGVARTYAYSAEAHELTLMPLEFLADPVLLAGVDWAPFEKIQLRTGGNMGAGSEAAVAEPPVGGDAAEPGEAAPAKRDQPAPPLASAAVVRLEVPKWVWAAALVLFASVCGLAFWYVREQRSDATNLIPSASQPNLDLEVKRTGTELDIRWDRGAAGRMGAVSGSLILQDGSDRVELVLDHLGLNSGKVLYVPKSGNLEILLTMNTPAGVVQELVRVLQGSTPGAITVTKPQRPPVRPAPPVPTTAQDSRPRTSTPTPTATSAEPQVSAPAPQQEQPAVAPPKPEPVQQQPVTPVPTPSAPVTNSAPPSPAKQEQPAPPPPETDTSATRTRTVPQELRQERPPVRTPVSVPPKPTRQVVPVVPPHLKALLPGTIVVEVKLAVDTDGRVTDAQVEAGSGVTAHLARVARDAARQWRFEPATLDGRPVPGQHVIHFKFGR